MIMIMIMITIIIIVNYYALHHPTNIERLFWQLKGGGGGGGGGGFGLLRPTSKNFKTEFTQNNALIISNV